MGLLSFRVVNQKAIVLAEAQSVPPVMVIAGPNGVGKSTLLYAIKNGAGSITPITRIFYQGPHRVLRRTQVQRRWLGGGMRWLADLLVGGDVSGYEGLNFHNSTRTPDNVDEVGSTIKHTLGRIENRRQSALAKLVDSRRKQNSALDVSAIRDVYEPLRLLTLYLLPHLEFDRVDFGNEDDIKCLWKRKDLNAQSEIDIDDLSSGEKSIIVLFLPLLEDQIRERLDQLQELGSSQVVPVAAKEDRVVLIDEAEQHLHPDLQAKILTYVRNASRETKVQFILTTHSPTILDQAYDDELYVLSAPSGDPAENQLRRIAGNLERLEALKQLAGSAYFFTTGRTIVCIEGEASADPDEPTDARLLELMYPRATAVTLVPTTGKGNVIQSVHRLREHVPEGAFRIRVRGLVDADQSEGSVEGVEALPVCMIENFLLDATVLFSYTNSLAEYTFPDSDSVASELRSICDEMVPDEIGRRVRLRLKTKTIRIYGSSVEEIKSSLAGQMEQLRLMLPADAKLEEIVTEVTAQVRSIVSAGTAVDRFRGKHILKTFYGRHIAPLNVSYATACIAIARAVGKEGKVAQRLDPIFERLIK